MFFLGATPNHIPLKSRSPIKISNQIMNIYLRKLWGKHALGLQRNCLTHSYSSTKTSCDPQPNYLELLKRVPLEGLEKRSLLWNKVQILVPMQGFSKKLRKCLISKNAKKTAHPDKHWWIFSATFFWQYKWTSESNQFSFENEKNFVTSSGKVTTR